VALGHRIATWILARSAAALTRPFQPATPRPTRSNSMLGINPPTASLLLDEASDLKPDEKMIREAHS